MQNIWSLLTFNKGAHLSDEIAFLAVSVWTLYHSSVTLEVPSKAEKVHDVRAARQFVELYALVIW